MVSERSMDCVIDIEVEEISKRNPKNSLRRKFMNILAMMCVMIIFMGVLCLTHTYPDLTVSSYIIDKVSSKLKSRLKDKIKQKIMQKYKFCRKIFSKSKK